MMGILSGAAPLMVDVRQTGASPHLDIHVAAALDGNGGVLGVESFPTTTAGFAELHLWLSSVRLARSGRS
jgi:hypothetical protein